MKGCTFPTTQICRQAMLTRDPKFDGVFFVAVKTTRVYCRNVCKVRMPKPTNVNYLPTAAAAEAAGYRPCLRCRPESAPFSPAWNGTKTTVGRAVRLISDGALDHGTIQELCARLGVGPRHLNRLFNEHLGASATAVAATLRIQRAKCLIDDTNMPMSEVALSSGFGSVRRFNAAILSLYGRSPSALRKMCKQKNI